MSALPIFQDQAKRVGVWVRVSTEDQAQGDSPEHHRTRAAHYCTAKGWEVIELYDLAGVSGKSVMEHAETKRMLADVKRGHITALVFSKLARLTRNARELMDFSDYFRAHNADLVSLQESIDTSSPAGRLFYNMVGCMAQWEREEIVDRVRASVSIRAKLGKPLGGRSTYGYLWDDKRLKPDPKEAPVRRLIYELFAEHKRRKTVARLLNERGHRTRDGHKWSDTTVERLIRDPAAKGLYRSNFTRKLGRKWELKPESEHVYTSVEPIVSEELWQQCNDILDKRRASKTKPGKPSVHVFTGTLRCACGGKMYVFSNSPKYVCAKCRNRIPCEDLEELFRERIRDHCVNPDTLAAYLRNVDATLAEKRQLADSIRQELVRLKEESEHILKLYMGKKITADRFGELDAPNVERKKQLEAELPQVEAQMALLQIDGLSQEHLAAEANNLYERWPKLTITEKRDMVDLITRSITVGNEEVTIELIHFPSFQEAEIRQRTDMVTLPIFRVLIQARLSRLGPHEKKVKGYPLQPQSLGEHLRRRRLDLGMTQEEARKFFGVTFAGYHNWEGNRVSPGIGRWPMILAFLGYDPFPPVCDTFQAAVSALRRRLGLDKHQFAKRVEVDVKSVRNWECGRTIPFQKVRSRLVQLGPDLTALALPGRR